MAEKTNISGVVDHDFFDESSFKALEKGLVESVERNLNFHLPDGRKGLLRVKFTTAFSASCEGVSAFEFSNRLSDTDEKSFLLNSLERSLSVLNKELNKVCMFLYGETVSEKPKHICVLVIRGLIATYSFKKDVEIINSKPHLN